MQEKENYLFMKTKNFYILKNNKMRLQEYDLTMACNRMLIKTDKKYAIIPTKSEYGYWSLELKNKDTGELERIAGSLTLREAYEYLRAFYKGMDFYLSNK